MPFGYKSVHCIIIMVKSDIPKYVFTSVAAVTSVGGGGKSTCQKNIILIHTSLTLLVKVLLISEGRLLTFIVIPIAIMGNLVPRPSHPSVCHLQYPALVLQATNAGVRRPGNEATSWAPVATCVVTCVPLTCRLRQTSGQGRQASRKSDYIRGKIAELN